MSEYTENIKLRCELSNEITLLNENTTVVGELYTTDSNDVDMKEIHANAQLFKAAPELLEVAEYSLEIVKTLECHCDSYNGFTCKKHEWKRKLERVIKKAKGELNANNN